MSELITNHDTVWKFVPDEGWDDYDITTVTRQTLMLNYLIAICHCRVVNFSMGICENLIYAANENEPHALNYLNAWSEALEPQLLRLIDNYPDFNIISSAGNENDDYYVRDWDSNNGYHGYKESNMFQLGATQGNIPASFASTFNYINNPIIKDRVIVVGAVENKTKNAVEAYSLCDFSNIGERVDVVAPGKDIVSTVDNNSYDKMEGTSMAAPHVTGIAAMLYSLNPDIKADEVKRIICETASNKVASYGLVNAEAAVKQVMGTGTIQGVVVSAKDGTTLEGVKVTAYQKLKSGRKLFTFNTKDHGDFSKELISGNYEFLFEKFDFQPLTMDITVNKDVTEIIQDTIVLQPIADSTNETLEEEMEKYGLSTLVGMWDTPNARSNRLHDCIDFYKNSYSITGSSLLAAPYNGTYNGYRSLNTGTDCFFNYSYNNKTGDLIVTDFKAYPSTSVYNLTLKRISVAEMESKTNRDGYYAFNDEKLYFQSYEFKRVSADTNDNYHPHLKYLFRDGGWDNLYKVKLFGKDNLATVDDITYSKMFE